MEKETTDEQKKLQALVDRRHPEYQEKIGHWEFLQATYDGGREWFAANIFKYFKEGAEEFKERVARAYRFNHTREVVDLVTKHLFKQEISRSADAPQSVRKFWLSSTLNELGIKDLMRRVAMKTSIWGRVWVVVDNTNKGAVASVKDEKQGDVITYAYIVTPNNALDMSHDELGILNWILIHEQARDDDDPMNSSGAIQDRYRLWERNHWTLFRKVPMESNSSKFKIEVDGPYWHGLGVVPVFAADNITSDELYVSSALIDDVAYLDRSVANYLSNLDAIIQDQTFSQLAMPINSMLPGQGEEGAESSMRSKLMEVGTKRIFGYDGEHGEPKFISPDVKQAELILQAINKIINEIYHTVGLAGERTKDDNSQGIDNSSGVAKAYDFERVNSLLAAKADSLQATENTLAWFVARWNNEEKQVDKIEGGAVSYPDNFDTRGLYDEFEIAARLSLCSAPDAVRREQMISLIDKLFPRLEKAKRDKMIAELKSWPPEEIDPATGGAVKKEGNSATAKKLTKK